MQVTLDEVRELLKSLWMDHEEATNYPEGLETQEGRMVTFLENLGLSVGER